MPNHITNILTSSKALIDSMKSKDSEFYFNVLVPMPAVMVSRSPHHGVIEYAKIAMGVTNLSVLQKSHAHPADSFKAGNIKASADALEQSNILRAMSSGPFPKDYSDADFEDFVACCRAIKETGFPSWYEWSLKHWGTKRNAYSIKRCSDTRIKFLTAWSMPTPIIEALINSCCSDLRLDWADENFGCNCGIIRYQAGCNAEVQAFENDSDAAREHALNVIYGGELPDHMERRAGKICYKEES